MFLLYAGPYFTHWRNSAHENYSLNVERNTLLILEISNLLIKSSVTCSVCHSAHKIRAMDIRVLAYIYKLRDLAESRGPKSIAVLWTSAHSAQWKRGACLYAILTYSLRISIS